VINDSLGDQIEHLRGALLRLEPTGEDGFEGLLAGTLTEITSVPFRLAGSGSQFGVDGKPVYEPDSICFEAKRYDGTIPKDAVLSKMADLSLHDGGETDLWVLGATSSVSTQLADDVRKFCQGIGISALILDWAGTGIPLLAVALAMSHTKTAEFLDKHLIDKGLAAKANASLQAIHDSDAFADNAARLRSELQEPITGIGIARRANTEWLTNVFSSSQEARRFLGQPISPQDLSVGMPVSRDSLVDKMKPFLTGKPDSTIAIVVGDEGNGKSWLVAQSWLALQEKPVMIVLTPDDFIHPTPTGNLEDILIGRLSQQTGIRLSDAMRKRWHRKLTRWRAQGATDAPRLVVLIDGLNQRPRIDWARFMETLASELIKISGRLIVTVRTHYFDNYVKRRLVSGVLPVYVPEWTELERDEILETHGIRGSELHAPVAASLKNPRLLGIALVLLKGSQIRDLDELSVSRLLFEHMRASERDAPSPQPAHKFARKLQDHATEILSRVAAKRRDDLRIFDGDLEAVSDGRFFVPVAGDPMRHGLAEEGLTLALGFSVLDQLQLALRNGHVRPISAGLQRDLNSTLDAIIEPISALDRTADVVLAAVTVACVDDDRPVEIAAALVSSFAEMQNPNAGDFNAFAGLARVRPQAFMKAAHDLCLGGTNQPNFDWIESALHMAKTDDGTWSVMSAHLRSWLAYYSLSPERGMLSRLSHESAEKREAERKKMQKEIDERQARLSPSERDVLISLTRKDDGELSALARLALTLMAGKPVAPFAESLVRWSFAESLNPDRAASSRELTQLGRFNSIDWQDAREAM